MQVNVQETVVHDPRLREVANALGWHHHRVLGALVEIMKYCAIHRTPAIRAKLADGYAECAGFAAALCDAELATMMVDGSVRLADELVGKQLGWLATQDEKREAANAKRRENAKPNRGGESDTGTGSGTATGSGTGNGSGSETETETKAGRPPGSPQASPPGSPPATPDHRASAEAVAALLTWISQEYQATTGKAWKPTPKARDKALDDLRHLVCSGFSELEINCRARAYFSDYYRPEWLKPPFTVSGFLTSFDVLCDAGAEVEADARAEAASRSQAAGARGVK